jgi:hypothetical protein
VAAHQPEPPQGAGEPQAQARVAPLDSPVQGGAQVVVLRLQLVEPGPLLLPVEPRPGGPLAYLGLWRRPGAAGGPDPSGSGLLLAVDAAAGVARDAAVLPGPPGLLVIAPALGGVGRRLYVVEGTGGAERLDPANAPDYLLAERWRLVALHPATLAPEGEYPLGEAPRALAVTPDGDQAYALAGPVRLGHPSTVLHLDLRTGSVRRLLTVPGSGVGGLALAGGSLFVPDPEGGAVSVVDPRRATVVRTTRVGGAPLAIAAGYSWPRAPGR